MKKIAGILLGLSLALGSAAAFEKADPPKTEKGKKKDKSASKTKNEKRKAEQPKAQ